MAKIDLSKEFCYLPNFVREDILMAQTVGQQFGWQIQNFDLPSAWKDTCGTGVNVAVLDTGVDLTHPDLIENLIEGYNVINPKLPPTDDNGHGTHVAGIIAASNNAIGVVGVSPCAKIIPIKVLNRMGAGRMDHVIEGIKVAVDKGADLICMSLGTRNPLDEVLKAIKKAADSGVVCFVAAGNAGRTAQLLYPAAYDMTISIGAVDENSMRASFSCTGPNLDFVAPGVDIYSTVPVSSYAVMSGTSQAAPFACGVGALLLSHHRMTKPGAKFKKEDYVKALSNNALTVENLDVKYAELGKRFFQGFGIINPVNFLDWVENKKVDSVAQTIAGALSDVGMLDTTKADVSALRKLSTDLNKALKQFPKVNQKAASKKAAVQKEMISSALLRRVSKQPAHNPQP
jgi:subtilisin family serine protease